MQTYIVQKGDTLYGISKQYGVSINDIVLQNNIINNKITVGDSLIIPTNATTSFYVVKKGDTLYTISKMYGVSVENIIKTNNIVDNKIVIGETLFIPFFDNIDFTYYTVLKGDSLYSISKKFNTTVNSLVNLNNLTSNNLSIGMKLKVPSSTSNNESDYFIYTVKSGDTLYSISNKYGVSIETIKKLNNLNSNNLYLGEQLKISKDINISNSVSLGSSCFGEGYSEEKYLNYTVKSGDNLYSISNKYGVSVDSIKKLNNLNNNLLSVGQILKIKEI